MSVFDKKKTKKSYVFLLTLTVISYILCIHLFWSDTKAVVLGRS